VLPGRRGQVSRPGGRGVEVLNQISVAGHLNYWVLFGLLGQVAFSLRFIIQWLVSEQKKESVIPVAFWYLSLLGGIILFVYAVYRRDIVFTIGQGSGLIVYVRNIVLISKKKPVDPASGGHMPEMKDG
jgi:lipid-A-disaccharide synthase-like uncharacterized protein